MRSLARVCAEREEGRWRRTDAAMERLGEAGIGPFAEQRTDLTPAQEREVSGLLAKGTPLKRIARLTGIGIYRVRKAARRMKTEEGR